MATQCSHSIPAGDSSTGDETFPTHDEHPDVSPRHATSRVSLSMATNSIKLLTGNSHPSLAKLVADRYVLCAFPWGV